MPNGPPPHGSEEPRRRRTSSHARLVRAAAVLLPLALAACGPSVLDPRGPVGRDVASILTGSVVIMLAIIVPTIAATLAFAWWFRASNPKARYQPGFVHSGKIELIVWAIPLLTITLLGGVTWIGSYQLDPATPLQSNKRTIEVEVVSLDWKWLFIYPNQRVASVNRLVVPAGAPIHFRLTSASVMNTFFVPQLGSMIYTMNGMASQLHLQADEPGSYHGISAHMSGDGFSDMNFEVRAVPQNDFSTWIDSTRKDGPVLDPGSYAELARQSAKVPAFTYREVDPRLFEQIVSQEIPPGPGPEGGAHGVFPRSEHH
jgi:cytochrome o ubiquinol oxidase subunit 2